MIWGTLDHIIRSATDWLFRRRSPWMLLIRIGAGLLAISVAGGLALSIKFPLAGEPFDLSIDTSAGTPAIITYSVAGLGGILVLVALALEVRRGRAEEAMLARKRVLVIEERGLRDTTDTPLINAVPAVLQGRRDGILVNLRQGAADGRIVSPDVALEHIMALPRMVEQHRGGLDRSDVSIVYGGLVSVPYAFLTGLLLDDESALTVLDWDRDAERWRPLDGLDDGDRFLVVGLDDIQPGARDVAVAVSVSYKVDLPGVCRTLGDIPVVQLDLPRGSTNCHWSEDKQRALVETFRDTMIALCNRHVGRLHLFVAAQNSVTFRLGRTYDKRNLPPVTVYQYERTDTPPFPWGISMPTHGLARPSIIQPEMV